MTIQELKDQLRAIQNNPWLQTREEVNVNADAILDLLGTPDDKWSSGHEDAALGVIETAAVAVKKLLQPLCSEVPRGESATRKASRECAEALIQKESSDWTTHDFNNAAASYSDLV